jgi:hypothetical protein
VSTFADFYDLLLPELPGCTTAMVDLHLREVAREFCRATSVWRQPLAAVNLVANQATYTVTAPASSELVRIVSITVAGKLLWLDTDAPPESQTPKYERADPPFTLSGDLTTLTLIADEVPKAAFVGGLVLVGALSPSAAATTIPDFIKGQYSEAIRYGVLSRLMVMGKKPWTDRPQGEKYEGKWNIECSFAATQGQRGNTRAPLRVKKWM